MRLIDVCIDGGRRLGLAGIEADGEVLLLPRDRDRLRRLMVDAIGEDRDTDLQADDVRDVGDAWALYDRLGRQNPGYGDTAAAHLARTMLEAFR